MTRSATDTLSLTLPKTRAHSRFKRPRKPTFWEAWFLAFTIWCIAFAVRDLLTGELPFGVWQAVGAGLYWTAYQRERRGVRRSVPQRPAVAWIAAGIALTVMQAAGAIS